LPLRKRCSAWTTFLPWKGGNALDTANVTDVVATPTAASALGIDIEVLEPEERQALLGILKKLRTGAQKKVLPAGDTRVQIGDAEVVDADFVEVSDNGRRQQKR